MMIRAEEGWGVLDLLDLLDPNAVVCDVEVVEYVGRFILPEDFVNIQKALEDTGFPWTRQHGIQMKKLYYSIAV